MSRVLLQDRWRRGDEMRFGGARSLQLGCRFDVAVVPARSRGFGELPMPSLRPDFRSRGTLQPLRHFRHFRIQPSSLTQSA